MDWDEKFDDCIHRDCYTVTLDEMNQYDIIWASPDCTTYSIASGGKYRKNGIPLSDYAIQCDINNEIFMEKIRKYKGVYFIENPRGNFRGMPFVSGVPRYTVTYCQYGYPIQKPTDIWTNIPNPKFKLPCKAGASCHIGSPSGKNIGLSSVFRGEDRARIPEQLCEHIVDICEEFYNKI